MKRMLSMLAVAGIGCVHADAPKDAGPAVPQAGMSAAECEVWNRELSFSRSVEAHDANAFAVHVHDGAVFAAGTAAPQRGRATVLEEWRPIIEGKAFALRWHPGHVAIGADPDIALSSGPAWTEDLAPNAKQRWTISRFTSTWVRGKDGQWRVLFDGAGAPPKPATAAEVAKLVASLPASCAHGSR